MPEPLKLELVTPPTKLPVGLDEAKKQLELGDDDTTHDAFLAGLLDAATEECERYTGRAGITRTYRLFLDRWPSDSRAEPWWEGVREGPISMLNTAARDVEIPRPPLLSVAHVKPYDDDDNPTTFSASNYFVDTASQPGRIALRTGAVAPVIERVANGLEVQFAAGYGANPGDVPEPLRQGILMTVAWMFTNRGDCEDAAKNSGAHAVWRKYRVLRL